MTVTYSTTILRTGRNTGIPVPDEVLEALGGGRRAAVIVDVDGYTYRTTVGAMGGQAMLAFSAAHRAASGLDGDAEVTVSLALDETPQVVEVPADLQAALDGAPAAKRFFEGLAPSYRRNFVTLVEAARQPATRARRIAATVEKLQAGRNR